MRRILQIAAAGLAIGGFSTAAQAAPVGVTISVNASLSEQCVFAQNEVDANLSNDNRIFTQDLTYSCNFPADLQVYMHSVNGQLVSQDEQHSAGYNINFASSIAGDGTNWFPVENITNAGLDGLLGTSQPGVESTIKLGIYLRDLLPAAGTYSDTIYLSVAP